MCLNHRFSLLSFLLIPGIALSLSGCLGGGSGDETTEKKPNPDDPEISEPPEDPEMSDPIQFESNLKGDTVSSGEPIELFVSVSGKTDDASFHWYRHNQGSEVKLDVTPDPRFVIPSASLSDNGKYYVEARVDDYSTKSNLVTVKVTNWSASLSWIWPESRVNDKPLPLKDIQEGVIFYVKDDEELTASEFIDHPNLNMVVVSPSSQSGEYRFDNLKPGYWHFRMTAIDVDGRVSDLSEEATKMID